MQICLVHLGKETPEHLWLNLQRISKLAPNLSLTLIGDDELTRKKSAQLGIEYFRYVSKPEENFYLSKISAQHDFSFRQGFWKYSLQRLFAVAQFAESQSTGVLHIESDVLLLEGFPFIKFQELLKKTAWQKFNSTHDVASLLWIPNSEEAKKLVINIIELGPLETNTTDMTVLSALAALHPETYEVIPSAGDIRQLNEGNLTSQKSLDNIEIFGGYFDSAAFGMWVFGQDPKNYYGMALRYQELPHSDVVPNTTTFQLKNGNTCFDSFGNQVFSFHIHSKDLRLFRDDYVSRLNFYFSTAKRESRSHIFNHKALILLLSDYKRRRMLLHLIYNFPILNKVLKRSPFRSKLRRLLRMD